MSKPTGPIPPYFPVPEDGLLRVGGKTALDLVAQAGSPLFVYDMDIVRQRVSALRAAMPSGLAIHYAIKANPNPHLLDHMTSLVDGFDIASAGELDFALKAGMDVRRISFAGPGKRNAELEAAIVAGVTLNIESENEARRAFVIGDRIGVTPRLAVRVNPDFDLKGSGMRMGGGAKPFGVDAAKAAGLVTEIIDAGAEYRGFHIFAGSQSLDSDAIIETQAATLALVETLDGQAGTIAPHVNLGGGFGVPYFFGDESIDIVKIGAALAENPLFAAMQSQGTQLAIELGRWLVAEAGVYLTQIVDRKQSHDRWFLVCDGGLHHQLAASGNFGTVVRRNYPIALANGFGIAATETVNVVGCLCTPLDRLGDDVALPKAEVGDVIAIFLAGAYGKSASPGTFLGQAAAAELIID